MSINRNPLIEKCGEKGFTTFTAVINRYVTYLKKMLKDDVVTIPKRVIQIMLDLDVFSNPDSFYLFGRDFRPSEHRADGRIFRERWIKVREALDFPAHYQFYSLKDTGITDAIDRVGLTVTKTRHAINQWPPQIGM